MRGVIEREGIVDELHAIKAPTLVIVGDEDVATVPAKAERIQQRIAGSRLEIVSQAGHSSSIEQPEAVSRLLADFYRGLDA